MPANLSVTLIQTPLHWQNIAANLEMFSNKVASINVKTDLIVLPEMFSTGFSMNTSSLAEDMNSSQAIEWMKKTAGEKNCAVTGSLMLRDMASGAKKGKTAKDRYFNRLVWMNADGSFQVYDKRHLFSLSQEEQIYTPGREKLIVELNGWKVCPLICYDLRFPVWSRNELDATGAPQYDLLLYVANWPERRIYAWKHLLIARAIENQSYVLGVNRLGNDGNDNYHPGDSMVLDALGNVLYHKQEDEDVFTMELDFEKLKKVRETLRFLKDADPFILNPKLKIKSH